VRLAQSVYILRPVETRSSRPHGSEFTEESEPETPRPGPDALVQEHAAHSPARRVDVQEEARSVVIAEEADDDKTPPHGHRVSYGSSPDLEVHSEELLSDPLPRFDDLTPSEPLPRQLSFRRPLPAYDHRNDPTIVLPRRTSSRVAMLFGQLAPSQLYAVIAALIVTGCAAAFMIGAAIMSFLQSAPQPTVRPRASIVAPSAVAAPSVNSIDAPVTLTDLPVVEE
jgi:hypothetical protein